MNAPLVLLALDALTAAVVTASCTVLAWRLHRTRRAEQLSWHQDGSPDGPPLRPTG